METRKRTSETNKSTPKKIAKFIGGLVVTAGVGHWLLAGSNGPSDASLDNDPKMTVMITATPGEAPFKNNAKILFASSIDGAINDVNPKINEPTLYALQQYVINKENNGTATAVPGEVFHIPEVNPPKK